MHYVENFLIGDERTGQYIAQQYSAEKRGETFVCDVDIAGSTFNRQGYKIGGWNTLSEPSGSNPGTVYQVGKTYDLCTLTQADGMGIAESACQKEYCTGINSDSMLLKLYAQWERKDYVIRFEKNKPESATVTGTMDDMVCTQGEADPLSENQYKCAGYVFQGWSLVVDDTHVDLQDCEDAYEIRQIQWPLPEVPTYVYSSVDKKITITNPVSTSDTHYQYCCNEIQKNTWSDNTVFLITTSTTSN